MVVRHLIFHAWPFSSMFISPLFILVLLSQIKPSQCQYSKGTPIYEQNQQKYETILQDQIQVHDNDDVPEPKDVLPSPPEESEVAFENILGYRISFPHPQDYTISLLINPCGVNSTISQLSSRQRNHDTWNPIPLGYDCCMNVFGRGEYGHLKKEAVTQQHPYPKYRIGKSDIPILAKPNEVFHNIHLVDEHGITIPLEESRRADDSTEIDEDCRGLRYPYPFCRQDRLRAVQSRLQPACMDYNQTVDSTLNCFTPTGVKYSHCIQIGFGQTSLIHICNEELYPNFYNEMEGHSKRFEHCGTFLEIHLPNGSLYDDEETVLSETKLKTRVTNGIVTTILPLYYKNNPNRILCDYRKTTIRVGSMVVINDQAPTCCCPKAYTKGKKLGSYFCPKKPRTKYGGGPFADHVDTIEEFVEQDDYIYKYPYCPHIRGEDGQKDVVLCSKQSSVKEDRYDENTGIAMTQGRFISVPCKDIVYNNDTNLYTSPDLEGQYDNGPCDYGDTFHSCATLSKSEQICQSKDFLFTFVGEIGKIVSLPPDISDTVEKYGVTFNDGRTTYYFYRHQIVLLNADNTNINSYEIWYVQRTSRERIVQKKKPFRVVNPKCTFDSTNGVYFPFSQLDENGQVLETYSEYDGIIEERDYVLDSM